MIWSLVVMSALIIIFAATAFAATEDGIGIMYAITVLHVILLIISLLGNILANRPSAPWEQYLTIGSFALMYVSALIYLFAVYDVSLVGTKKKDIESEADFIEREMAINFITGELIVIPFITAFIALSAKAYRDNSNGRSMTTGFWILLALNAIHAIALIIIMFELVDETTAWLSLGVFLFAFYAFTQYVMRVKYSSRALKISQSVSFTPYMQKRMWSITNIVLAVALILGTLIYVGQNDELAAFLGYSMVIGIIVVILLVLTLATFIADRTRMDVNPIYHSPWIFPIYKYYPE